MSYSKKLHYFFKAKNISNKELAERLDVSETMIGRYLKGEANFPPSFIMKMVAVFPDIDLQYIFSEEATAIVGEVKSVYGKKMNVIDELSSIQERIELIKQNIKTEV